MVEGSRDRWLHVTRRIEFEEAMQHIPLGLATTALEIGSGDGFQLGLLRQRFDRVYAIDPESRPAQADGFAFSAAEALPFPDSFFDLVISSNVIEHLDNRPRGIEEAVRVLKPGGYMAHIVPVRFWKVVTLLWHPIGYPIFVGERWWELRTGRGRHRVELPGRSRWRPRPKIRSVLWGWLRPGVHGTSPSHLAEYRMFGQKSWRKAFDHPKLVSVAEVPLLSYSAYGLLRLRLLGLRRWLAGHGLPSSCAFILRKVE